MSTIDKDTIIEALKLVDDPEMGIDIYNLGLVYDIAIEGSTVTLTMTLTSMGCPAAPRIEADTRQAVARVQGVENVQIAWTFSPPWGPDKVTEEGRDLLSTLGYM